MGPILDDIFFKHKFGLQTIAFTYYIQLLQTFHFLRFLTAFLCILSQPEQQNWNLNTISAHKYAKLSLLRAYLAFDKFDIIFLSETYLNSSNLPDDETLEILDTIQCALTTLVIVNMEEFCIYYKNYLALRIISVNYLSECINFEVMIGKKICYLKFETLILMELSKKPF